jgi:hypothetical protein
LSLSELQLTVSVDRGDLVGVYGQGQRRYNGNALWLECYKSLSGDV